MDRLPLRTDRWDKWPKLLNWSTFFYCRRALRYQRLFLTNITRYFFYCFDRSNCRWSKGFPPAFQVWSQLCHWSNSCWLCCQPYNSRRLASSYDKVTTSFLYIEKRVALFRDDVINTELLFCYIYFLKCHRPLDACTFTDLHNSLFIRLLRAITIPSPSNSWDHFRKKLSRNIRPRRLCGARVVNVPIAIGISELMSYSPIISQHIC
jgi:hypothetical protein